MTHSPEPWKISKEDESLVIRGSNEVFIAVQGLQSYPNPEVHQANIDRIVACVNACAGIPDDHIKEPFTREVLKAIAAKRLIELKRLWPVGCLDEDPARTAKIMLDRMSDEERLDLFRDNYCTHCGCDDPTCQCWNDE